MSRPWTITLEKNLKALAHLRCEPGLELGLQQALLWLKSDGRVLIDNIIVKQLPATARYYIDEEKRLFRLGEITPRGTLPDLSWKPIDKVISVTKPTAAMPANLSSGIEIELIQSHLEREAEAMLLPFRALASWAEDAPAFRLEKLRFAVSEHGEALVIGKPLPPLPGQTFWCERSLLFPAGFALKIPALTTILESKIRSQHPDVQTIIFHSDSQWEVISKGDFQPLSRSAVRNTWKEVGDG